MPIVVAEEPHTLFSLAMAQKRLATDSRTDTNTPTISPNFIYPEAHAARHLVEHGLWNIKSGNIEKSTAATP